MNYRIILFSIFFVFICNIQCTKEDSNIVNPSDLKLYSKDFYAYVPVQNINTVSISNSYDGIIVNGWCFQDSIRVYLYKQIHALSGDIAESHFDNITFQTNTINDTITFTIDLPIDTDEIKYHCPLYMDIPYNMLCHIVESEGSIITSQLDTILHIQNAKEEVEVENHNGSCTINSYGEISVKMRLPDNGYCILNTISGNIDLQIPDTTSSTIYAKSDYGTVTYNGLNIENMSYNNSILTGTLSTGQGEINLHTQNGNITISGL